MTEKYSRKGNAKVKHINKDDETTLCGLDLEWLCSVSNYDGEKNLPTCKKCRTIKTIADGV